MSATPLLVASTIWFTGARVCPKNMSILTRPLVFSVTNSPHFVKKIVRPPEGGGGTFMGAKLNVTGWVEVGVEVLVHDTIPINKDRTTKRLKTASDLFKDVPPIRYFLLHTWLVKSAKQSSFQELIINSLK